MSSSANPRTGVSCFVSGLALPSIWTLRALARADDVAWVRTVYTRLASPFMSNMEVVLGWVEAKIVNIENAEPVTHDVKISEGGFLAER